MNLNRIFNWKWLVLGLLALGLVAVWFFLPVERWAQALQGWVRQFGAWGVLIFGVIYILAVVMLVPGSALTLAAGFIYGLWGAALALVAATTGASLAFLIARYLAHAKVSNLIEGRAKLQAIEKAVSEEGWKIVGLIRLSPLVPFNLQNYFFGITHISFLQYVLATAIGIIPGTLVNVYVGMIGGVVIGGQVSPLQWSLFAVGLIATVIVTWIITRKAKAELEKAGVSTAKA